MTRTAEVGGTVSIACVMMPNGLPPKYMIVDMTSSNSMATSRMTPWMAWLYVVPIMPPSTTINPMMMAETNTVTM